MERAIALIEVQAMAAAVEGLDAMLKAAAGRVGTVKLCEVIPRPHEEIKKFLYTDDVEA